MNKNGGYTWIQTCATVVCSVKNADEQNIICVNYVITGRENSDLILDQCQLGIVKREPIVCAKNDNELKSPEVNGDRNNGKGNAKNNESKAADSINLSSLESSNKAVVRPVDDELATVPSKRGRKRKVKCEAKDESPTDNPSITETRSEISNLENALSKHFPKPTISDSNETDFSANSLLRQHADSDKSQQSSFNNFSHQSSSPMPATALLRQLYANRESVIRATARPTNYMYSDTSQQQSLPTPPNDSYDSQYLRKSNENYNNLVSSYGAYPAMEYSNAMTPPSSVSPRDLTNHKNYEYVNLTTSTGDSRVHYQTNNSTEASLPHLPLKPHPYSIHQMDSSYTIDHQSQYFPYHSGFHLYHKGVYTPP